VSDEAAAEMSTDDLEMAELGPVPYESRAPEARVPPPATATAIEPPKQNRALGMLKHVFTKGGPAAPRRQGNGR
jgi:hypothetical protein